MYLWRHFGLRYVSPIALWLLMPGAVVADGQYRPPTLDPSIRREELAMAFAAWVTLGLAAGFISGQLPARKGGSILPNLLLGLAGGVAGGWSFYVFGPPAVNGLHLTSLAVATFTSVVVLVIYHFASGR
jgi:uncharacterized membrane protein YeaQ/YmgE (transglycosylase-associated protein family)